jgi:hypothetical protein
VLPLLDSHSVVVPEGDAAAWRGIVRLVSFRMSSPAAARYARLVGCVPAVAGGPRPVDVGSTVPGFEVTTFEPGHELVVGGRHHFARYELVFRVSAAVNTSTDGASATVAAETRAEFPGRLGRLYRLLVIGTRFHVIAVRRMLRSVAREAAVS